MTLRTIALAGLVLLATAAQAETRLYTIDSKNAEEIRIAIAGVVNAQCHAINLNLNCPVELLPTGQLVIEAPAASHEQVAQVLKAIAERDAATAPRVTLQYWVISGSKSAPGREEIPSGLASVVAQLRRLHGDLAFRVEESATLTTESGTRAVSEAGALTVVNEVRATGDLVRAEVTLDHKRPAPSSCSGPEELCQPVRHELGVTVTLRRDEYVVLGERAFETPGGSGTTFYVVHWPD